MSEDLLTLANMAGGAVLERFNIEMQKVITNIADPNTDPKKKRSVTIKVTVSPNEQRNMAVLDIETKPTLVPAMPVNTSIVIDRDKKGNVVAAELLSNHPVQRMIDVETGEIVDGISSAKLTAVK